MGQSSEPTREERSSRAERQELVALLCSARELGARARARAARRHGARAHSARHRTCGSHLLMQMQMQCGAVAVSTRLLLQSTYLCARVSCTPLFARANSGSVFCTVYTLHVTARTVCIEPLHLQVLYNAQVIITNHLRNSVLVSFRFVSEFSVRPNTRAYHYTLFLCVTVTAAVAVAVVVLLVLLSDCIVFFLIAAADKQGTCRRKSQSFRAAAAAKATSSHRLSALLTFSLSQFRQPNSIVYQSPAKRALTASTVRAASSSSLPLRETHAP